MTILDVDEQYTRIIFTKRFTFFLQPQSIHDLCSAGAEDVTQLSRFYLVFFESSHYSLF